MKSILLAGLCSLLFFSAFAQPANPAYDQALADSLGADAMGMKQYYMVILKTGPKDKVITKKAERDKIFQGHFSNMRTMANAGKLVVAGPIGQNDKTYRGLYIFNAKSMEEALELAKSDPAVSSGIMVYEVYPWYGSAALPMYLKYADKIAKQSPF